MSDTIAFIGFLFPPAIDLINRYVSNSDARFWLSVLFCLVIGAVVAGFNGQLTPDGVSQQAMIYIAQAQLSYKLWENTQMRKSLGLTGGEKS